MNENLSHFERHIIYDSNRGDAVEQLATDTGLSKQSIKQAMQKGAVWITRDDKTWHLRRASKLLQPGDTVHFYYDQQILATVPPPAFLVADEGAYSVWDKPYGMWSQGSKWGDHCTITRWVEQHLQPQRPAFLVHRLDRAASGLILVAHQKRTAAALSKLFHDRAIDKRYRVIVHGCFPTTPQQHTLDSNIDGKSAISHVTRLKYDPKRERSLLEVNIETGRKHQIRRHLAESGFPVVGDRLYGRDGDSDDLQLAAVYLAFKCPVSQLEKQFQLPKDRIPTL